jgi:hypothetical protein
MPTPDDFLETRVDAEDIILRKPVGPIHDPESRFSGSFSFGYLDGFMWTVLKDLGYRTKAGPICTVRKGFQFDWASIPRPFWIIVPPTGTARNPYGIAAVFHDWIYEHGKIAGVPVTRSRADSVFLEILRYVGVNRFLASSMYLAVRVGGWFGWRRARKKEKRSGSV